MKFLLVDDEPLALADLNEILEETVPGHETAGFTSIGKALEYMKENQVDVAFLDIEMVGMNGIELARTMKDLQPDINIIFVTAHPQYAVDAYAIHATGYLLKPVVPEYILRELTFIYGDKMEEKNIYVQTFGGFCVYLKGEPLVFSRSKSRELFALLVERQGAPVTTREACAILWEDAPYDTAQKNYFHLILHDLRTTLSKAGIEDVLMKKRNALAINPSRLECDSYRFMEGNPQAIQKYRRNYMPEYSWAEFHAAALENKLIKDVKLSLNGYKKTFSKPF